MVRTLQLYPPAHPVFAVTAHDIGVGYVMRKELSGEPTDVDQAERHLRIAALRTADPSLRARAQEALAELAEPRRPPPPADRLRFLAGPGSRPQRPASMVGDDVAELAAHAVQLRIALQQYERTGDLANLTVALVARGGRNNDVADLGEAIPHARRAVRLTPHDAPERSGYLGVLGTALVYRSMLTGDRLDADESIAVGQEVLAGTRSAAERADAHTKLANRLRHRFRLTGQIDDSDAAIGHLRAAYGMTNDPALRAAMQEALDERAR